MNYTAKDIERAKELKLMGYNWIATNKNGRPFAFGRMPYRCADDSNEYNIWDNQPGTPWLMLSKEYFKSITWENEPVYIDEIITGGKVQVNGDTVIDRLTAENQRLKEEVTEQESIAEYEHATQMEWFSIAGDYKAENAELKKRLDSAIELPCKVGDTVYSVFEFPNEKAILKGACEHININIFSGFPEIFIKLVFETNEQLFLRTYSGNDLNNIFLLRSDAEARLAELKEGEQ